MLLFSSSPGPRILARIFLFSMFRLVNSERSSFWRSGGYALLGGLLYVVGGYYIEHDVQYCIDRTVEQLQLDHTLEENTDLELFAKKKVQSTVPKHLDVPTYNLRTREWVTGTPHLKGAKPNPIVFVYKGKIFALRRHHCFRLHHKSPPCEVLDTNIRTPLHRGWTNIPHPPYNMRYYSHHILDEENGILSLFFRSLTNFHEGSDEEDLVDQIPPCYMLNLNEKVLKWCPATINSKPNPDCRVSLGMRHISPVQALNGCFVDNIFFCYEKNYLSGDPVILGHDFGRDDIMSEPWVIGLDEVLKGKVEIATSSGFLNHIENLRFCLVLKYTTGDASTTDGIFSFTFDLVKTYLVNQHRRVKNPCATKALKADKFEFDIKPISDRAFQLPLAFSLELCKKM